jgi:5-methylcytosine-specific restriction endonuclease McrA
MKCKICGKNCEKEYCFTHKPKKPLSSGKGLSKMSSKPQKKLDKSSLMKQFFINFWKKHTPHVCEVCNKSLGSTPLTYHFDHVLEKSKYPEFSFEEENIMYICLECHDKKSRGHYSDVTIKRIEYLKTKFNIK